MWHWKKVQYKVIFYCLDKKPMYSFLSVWSLKEEGQEWAGTSGWTEKTFIVLRRWAATLNGNSAHEDKKGMQLLAQIMMFLALEFFLYGL